MKLLSILALSIFAALAVSASASAQPTVPHGPCTTINAQNECIGWAAGPSATPAPAAPYQQQYVAVVPACPYGMAPVPNFFGYGYSCPPLYYGPGFYRPGFGVTVRIGGGGRRR